MIITYQKGIVSICVFMFFTICYMNSFTSYDESSYTKGTFTEDTQNFRKQLGILNVARERKYLINTTNCQIPDTDPFNEEIISFFHKEEYTKCSDLDLLTYIERHDDKVTLNVNVSLIAYYSSYGVTCCYSNIHRVDKNDNKVRFSSCQYFELKAIITHPFIKVSCWNIFYLTVYENVHAAAILREPYISLNHKDTSFSVIMVGIDSMSKQNLERTMPKSYNYLKKHYVDLRGYNKVGDNTLPNLMPILTGKNLSQSPCLDGDSFNKCDFIWDTFKSFSYTTAYAEDECFLTTFNWLKPGFQDPPTDFYYRPYLLAAEQLPSVKSKCHSHFCAGPEASGERILNSAKDFAITFKNTPSFGFFWINSFSHDNINCPSAMDEKVVAFLSDKKFVASLKNTIFIFFSDHGYRFGEIRYTNTGSLEERLPFIYFFIPDKFKKQFPKEYKSFMVNSQRLTTPYDVHNTLQHVIKMANEGYEFNTSLGCSKCQSLFREIDEARSCEDASIDQHWCTCRSFDYMDPSDRIVTRVALFAVNQINTLIENFPEASQCANYSLEHVHSAGVSAVTSNDKNQSRVFYLVIVKTKPDAMFEATVEVTLDSKYSHFKLSGDISRLSRYADTSHCVANGLLKKYCYCDDFISVIKSKICNYLSVC